MKLPKMGALVRADGSIAWMWSHPTEVEADMVPPLLIDVVTGTVTSAGMPDDVIVQLDTAFDGNDMLELHAQCNAIRLTKVNPQGKYRLQEVHEVEVNGQKQQVVTDHYLNEKLSQARIPPRGNS